MPDNNGVYTPPTPYNPVVTGTVITSTWANTTMNDIATALTARLSRSGVLPMTGALTLFGNAVSPLQAVPFQQLNAISLSLTGDVTGTGSPQSGIVTTIKPSVALTGAPTAPTAPNGTNTAQLATTAFTNASITTANVLTGDVTGTGTLSGIVTTIKPNVDLTGAPTTTTAPALDMTNKIATTAFVTLAISGGVPPAQPAPPSFVNQVVLVSDGQTFVVPSGVYSIRAYVFGKGSDGAAGVLNTRSGGGGGGGGCSFGTILVNSGDVFDFQKVSTTAKLRKTGIDYLTTNDAANAIAAAGGIGGAAGSVGAGLGITASGAFAGGTGGAGSVGTANRGGGAGASSGSVLGAGVNGVTNTGTSYLGGSGWGGIGGTTSGGGGVGAPATVAINVGGTTASGASRGWDNAYTDPLLRPCNGSAAPLNDSNGQAGIGGGVTSTTAGKAGGLGAGGGSSTLTSGTAVAGAGGFGGGGGTISTGTANTLTGGAGGIGGGGGGGFSNTSNQGQAGVGGGACVVIFY